MADYRDNVNTTDDLDSITLRELEPMNSNPYVRISLDSLGGPATTTDADRRRQREADRRAEAERQKKAKKRKQQEAPRPKSVEPSLHVIIERAPEEDYYDDYDYAPSYQSSSYAGRDERPAGGYGRSDAYEARDPYAHREDRFERERSHKDAEHLASRFPSIPNNLMYGVEEPELSASAPVPTSEGSWKGQQPGYQQGGPYRSGSAAAAPERRSFDGYQQQPYPARRDSAPIPEPSVHIDVPAQQPSAERYAKQAEPASGFIKRPWSEMAFNEHTAASVSPANTAPVAVNNPRAAASATQAKSPSINIPSINIPNPAPQNAAMGGASRIEARPFPPAASQQADPYAGARGMGSWKRNAAEAARRDVTNNPRINAQTGTVNIPMPQSEPPAPAPAMGAAREPMSGTLSIPMPPKRQTTIQTYGAPLIEEGAAKDSAMFDESPVSIADGMKSADKKRKRRRGIIIAVVAVVVAVAAAVAFLLYNGTIKLDSIIPNFPTQQQSSATSSSASSSAGSAGAAAQSSSSSSRSSSNADQSGTVVYEYTATTSDGVAYTVNDTVTFNAEGKCQTTHMVLGFPDEATCADFLDNLQRDYGSAYALDSHDGANATVTIDISSLKFDREEYEDALRYSVEDLTVLKK